MNITFHPLAESHFPLMLKWLKAPHVKVWWDPEINWTLQKIKEKYATYVKGYKLEQGEVRKIHAYVILVNDQPIGYIQLYNAYDFPRGMPLVGLPQSLAAFDMFIGEKDYLGKGVGSQALRGFLDKFGNPYDFIFADPDIKNIAAIRTYEKVGFKKIKETDAGEVWMIRNQLKSK